MCSSHELVEQRLPLCPALLAFTLTNELHIVFGTNWLVPKIICSTCLCLLEHVTHVSLSTPLFPMVVAEGQGWPAGSTFAFWRAKATAGGRQKGCQHKLCPSRRVRSGSQELPSSAAPERRSSGEGAAGSSSPRTPSPARGPPRTDCNSRRAAQHLRPLGLAAPAALPR